MVPLETNIHLPVNLDANGVTYRLIEAYRVSFNLVLSYSHPFGRNLSLSYLHSLNETESYYMMLSSVPVGLPTRARWSQDITYRLFFIDFSRIQGMNGIHPRPRYNHVSHFSHIPASLLILTDMLADAIVHNRPT